MEKNSSKRLFFGMEIIAPWPEKFPKGRLLDPVHRHLTLSFLGNLSEEYVQKLMESLSDPHFPLPDRSTLPVGQTGYFDSCLLLPPRHPRALAWRPCWWKEISFMTDFQKILQNWLKDQGYSIDTREWMPHVTLCRQPFNSYEWKKNFIPLPFYIGSLHLYESKGNLFYEPLWTFPILAPFEEMSHTADIAFLIRGKSFLELYHHAFTALAFKAPELVPFFYPGEIFNNLDDIIAALNGVVSRADGQVGSRIKAVSYHGKIIHLENSLIQWEMLADV